MKRLTNEELQAIKERVERATRGYWWVKYGLGESVEINVGHGFSARYIALDVLRSADAEFIAAAREDVPKLLAEIERLRSLISCLDALWDLSEEFDSGQPYDVLFDDASAINELFREMREAIAND